MKHPTITAVIFDLDGVLSDTESLHAHLESVLLRRHGIEMSPEEISHQFAGVPDEIFFPQLFARFGRPLANLDALVDGKWQELMTQAREGRIPAVPGAPELVRALEQRGFPLAVASSSRRPFIELVLQGLQLRHHFSVVVSVEDVERSKPDPSIFLLAARRLGAPPRECLVIEDSLNGMRAAKSAGMICVGLAGDHDRPGLPADILVTRLDEVLHRVFDA